MVTTTFSKNGDFGNSGRSSLRLKMTLRPVRPVEEKLIAVEIVDHQKSVAPRTHLAHDASTKNRVASSHEEATRSIHLHPTAVSKTPSPESPSAAQ